MRGAHTPYSGGWTEAIHKRLYIWRRRRPRAKSAASGMCRGGVATAVFGRWWIVIGVVVSFTLADFNPLATDGSVGQRYEMPMRFRRLTRRCSSQMQLAAGISSCHASAYACRGRREGVDAVPLPTGIATDRERALSRSRDARKRCSRPFPEAMLKWSGRVQGKRTHRRGGE